ncbi:MAG: fused MFS/spermidine synthase [Alphaproteobacteria bacterium]
MRLKNRTFLLFLVIILEGYVVLSTELLAIRQSISFVGSGTDTVSILIAAILMPLAFGYYAGGRFRPDPSKRWKKSVRSKLLFNLCASLAVLIFGLSYFPLTSFFFTLIDSGIEHRLALTAIYAALFLVVPVFLLGQTIPLVSHYFSKEKLAEITGRMLFFSTLGSFMGAVFSTLVLMATIGVHNTVSTNFIILAGLIFLLSKDKKAEVVICGVTLMFGGILMNSPHIMRVFHIVSDNQYNTTMVIENPNGDRHLVTNNNASSKYNPGTGDRHDYIEFAEEQAIGPILNSAAPKNVLVIGAGAFTFGVDDTTNHYDYVDIDPALKDISEDFILGQSLTGNKTFHPVEARAYLRSAKIKYDVVLLDAYLGNYSIPEHLVTREFFRQVRDVMNEGGVVVTNFIVSPNFNNAFSQRIDATFRSVFPYMSRHAIGNRYDAWNEDPDAVDNVVYIARKNADDFSQGIYTDDKNTIFYDKPQRR